MKTIFTLCAILVGGVAFGGETVSVLNHNTSAPAAVVVAAPAPVVVASAPVVVTATPVVVESSPAVIAVQQPSRKTCANGKCKLYSVDQQQNEFHRNRLLGGTVTRKGTRTVVRPVR
jgi:hypothetical protein